MTNQLFREVLEGQIPLARKRIRPGFYFLPSLADPTAPTVAELNAGVDLSNAVTIDGYSPTPWPHMTPEAAAREEERQARNAAISEAAKAAGQSFADMEAAFMAFTHAASKCNVPDYTKPTPTPPWAGNIATQKRRKKL